MRLIIKRYSLEISPRPYSYPDDSEYNKDVAFIEDVLGLKKEGDEIKLKRINCMGLSSIAYLETIREKNK